METVSSDLGRRRKGGSLVEEAHRQIGPSTPKHADRAPRRRDWRRRKPTVGDVLAHGLLRDRSRCAGNNTTDLRPDAFKQLRIDRFKQLKALVPYI